MRRLIRKLTQFEFGDTPEKIEASRQLFLTYFFAIVGSVFLIPLGLASVWSQRYFLGLLLLTCAAVFLWLLRFTRNPANMGRLRATVCGLISLLSLYLILWGGVEGTGVYYTFALCMLIVSFAGPRAGPWVALVFLVVLSLGLYSKYSGFYPYLHSQKLRIILGIGLTFMMMTILEWMRMASYGALSAQSENLKQTSVTDALTGLLNRNGLKEGLARWQHEQFPAVLALIDIDHFKAINDRHGHHVGDQALVVVSQIFRRHTKGRDLIARWGGEEFALVLAASTKDNMLKVLNDIRETLQSTQIQQGNTSFTLGFSAGVSELTSLGDWKFAMNLADKHLYMAKAAGRDRFIADE